uniref:Predicted protein n=1 Tax=Hordeum vulgare subsp. vulgare TaxID=112509 RepID=F2DVH0_HORVV|nr:predicted protein [Hordeum vulgare subsp. vulgare]
MFGYTKAGKTASCHILANSPLRAELQNGELIYKATSQRYSHAVIGNSNQSQTEMPNIFETKYRSNGKLVSVTLLDQPGHGDSYGFHRIFSSGYFHYRTFSKTPRLKFILAFKKDDLRGTAEKFKGTISNFINTFSNYKTVKGKILNASVFLVTNVPPKSSI